MHFPVQRDKPLRQVTAQELVLEPLIFRSRGSATQREVNRIFERNRLSPQPRLVLDTRDGLYEAVVNGIGIGFVWRHGTGRQGDVHRLDIQGAGAPVQEEVFALAETSNPLVEAFFAEAVQFVEETALA